VAWDNESNGEEEEEGKREEERSQENGVGGRKTLRDNGMV